LRIQSHIIWFYLISNFSLPMLTLISQVAQTVLAQWLYFSCIWLLNTYPVGTTRSVCFNKLALPLHKDIWNGRSNCSLVCWFIQWIRVHMLNVLIDVNLAVVIRTHIISNAILKPIELIHLRTQQVFSWIHCKYSGIIWLRTHLTRILMLA